MKFTKTSALGIVGLIAALLAANSAWLNPYLVETTVAILMLIVYNLWPSDQTGGKPSINIINALSLIAAIAGYFLDHPRETVDAKGLVTQHYLIAATILASVKNTIVAVIRFVQTSNG
jgi:hypothetical protein